MRLPDDFWAVSEADQEMTLARFVVTFLTFGLWVAAILGVLLLVWVATP
jgi:hypothetical protein